MHGSEYFGLSENCVSENACHVGGQNPGGWESKDGRYCCIVSLGTLCLTIEANED